MDLIITILPVVTKDLPISPEQGKLIFSCPRSRLRILSRKTVSAVPSRVSLLILHTQAESGACSKDIPDFPRWRLSIPSTAIGSVPSQSGHAIAYRWRPLPKVHRHRASSPQGSSSNGRCLFRFSHGPINARLSLPTPTIGMKSACAIQKSIGPSGYGEE